MDKKQKPEKSTPLPSLSDEDLAEAVGGIDRWSGISYRLSRFNTRRRERPGSA